MGRVGSCNGPAPTEPEEGDPRPPTTPNPESYQLLRHSTPSGSYGDMHSTKSGCHPRTITQRLHAPGCRNRPSDLPTADSTLNMRTKNMPPTSNSFFLCLSTSLHTAANPSRRGSAASWGSTPGLLSAAGGRRRFWARIVRRFLKERLLAG